jgi:hypothetical protein
MTEPSKHIAGRTGPWEIVLVGGATALPSYRREMLRHRRDRILLPNH